MAHDSHFLTRLSRVNARQADMALELYRDPARVQYILSQVPSTQGHDRVAIALEDGPKSPHVIVARNGVFITCLGEGMVIGAHPRITRPQLDRLDSKWRVLHAAKERVSSDQEFEALQRKLLLAGPAMSREDMALLAMFNTLTPGIRLATYISDELQAFAGRYRPNRYRKRARPSQTQCAKLKRYWQLTWALAHLAVISGEHARSVVDTLHRARGAMPELYPDTDPARVLAWPVMRTLSMPAVIRGAWQVARGGSQMLDVYERYFRDMSTWTMFIDCSLGILALGLRHGRLRSRARRILARRDSPLFEYPQTGAYCDVMLSFFSQILESSKLRDDLRAGHRTMGAGFLVHLTSGWPEDHRHRYEHPDQVPDELAYALPLCSDGPILQLHQKLPEDRPSNLLLAAQMLAWVATAELEELYLPATFWDGNGIEWEPSVSLELLDGQVPYTSFGQQPVRAPTRIGRNQPCPCGSGQKYKRCCIAADAPVERDPLDGWAAEANTPRTVDDYASILAALRDQDSSDLAA